LYSPPNIIRVIKSRRMRWAGHVARMGEGWGAYRILVRRPEERRQFEIPRHGWEDNIKIDLKQVGWGAMDWIELAQDRDRWRAFVTAVMNLGFHKMRGISWLAEKLLDSQEGLCSMELVSCEISRRHA
jgi:hypothetical protein